jgi:sarcosine oxidase
MASPQPLGRYRRTVTGLGSADTSNAAISDLDVDVAVVGAGLAGAAAGWALARRGRSVAIFEQFSPGHLRGSSHGSARIVRRAYGDGLYVSLTGAAFELWRELETASGAELLHMYGGLDFGPRRDVATVARLLGDAGVPHEVLPAGVAESRWPGMRFEGDVVFHPQAGVVDAARAVDTFLAQAAAQGAVVRFDSPVVSVQPDGLRLSDGTSVRAGVTVVAAGAWLEPLLGAQLALPPLSVTQQQVFHLPRRDRSVPPWPSVIHEGAGYAVYHLDGGRDAGPGHDRKIGEHDGGRGTTAAGRDGVVDPAARARVVQYVQRWLPGLEPVITSEVTCLYTETPSEDFILDRVDDVIVCSPCSGHGAKFAPLIGELVADLVDDADAGIPRRFRLATHAEGLTGAVSL